MSDNKNQIFIGFAKKDKEMGRTISTWVEEEGVKPYPWTDNDFSNDNEELFRKLINVAKNDVIGAIFIIGEDEDSKKLSYNVLIEYGLYVGILGKNKVKLCVMKNADLPSDIKSVLSIDLDKIAKAEENVTKWVKELPRKNITDLESKELIILKHLAERKYTHGYTTYSYLIVYGLDQGVSETKINNIIDKYINNDLINKEEINKEKVYFITQNGISEADKKIKRSVTILETVDKEIIINSI